jgi:hypothetical protein
VHVFTGLGQVHIRAEVEEKREEREEAGCKLIAGLDIRTKKLYETDKWVMY